MLKSIYRRQFILMAGMILLSFALLGGSFIVLSYQYTLREKQHALERNARYIANYTGIVLSRGLSIRDESFLLYINSIAMVSDTGVMLCENNGEIVYSSGMGRGLAGRYVPEAVVRELLQSGRFSSLTNLGGLYPQKKFVSAAPIEVNWFQKDVRVGLVFVAAEMASITEMWRAFAMIFFLAAAAALCVAFITSSVTSLRLSRPMREMADATQKFAHGEFGVRVDSRGRKDEIGALAEAFNSMADALAKAEARRREFVANISHELKTPMTTISGFADGILDGTVPPEREQDALAVISAETRRLSRLVTRMLDLSRLQSTERAIVQDAFDISEVMIRILLSLESKINARNLDINADSIAENSVMVWGEQDSITQVVYNLLDNAIKFSHPGGVVSVRILQKAGKAHISIINQGETIPPEQLSLLFDRFHKADSSRSADRDGVGLGLYIVKTILGNHKETISVKSENRLTEFVFTLSLA